MTSYVYDTGQILAACAQPFIMFAPTKLAAKWFSGDQRATANMMASMGRFILVYLFTFDKGSVLASSAGGPGFNPKSRTASYQGRNKNSTTGALV